MIFKTWVRFVFILHFLFLALVGQGQKNFLTEHSSEKDSRMRWWRDATFGMFIHWGLYSIPAGEYKGKGGGAEWIMETHKIPITEYEKFAGQFNPLKFDADEWVKIAKNAGMKYVVITSKHHDGFCLWDSKYTNYDVLDASPFKRDIIKELSDACKKEGLAFGLYHSIMDWHHPDAKSKDYPHQDILNPNFSLYREEYLKPQLQELITKYDPSILWFDGEWIPEWTEEQGKDLYNFVRNLKPSIIINNRIGKARSGMQGMNKFKNAAGDFGTPEQEILEVFSNEYWESCMTINDHWGFSKEDTNWKSPQQLINTLTDVAAKGGNFLLNVGPTAEGLIPPSSINNLVEMGKWLHINQEAIYNTNAVPHFKEGENIRFTQSSDKKYIYIIANNHLSKSLTISTISHKRGTNLSILGINHSPDWNIRRNKITINLPENLPSPYGFVIKLEGKSIGKGFKTQVVPKNIQHIAKNLPIQFTTPPNDLYGMDKKLGLTDGRCGTNRFDDGYWLGWFGHDIEGVIDLGKVIPITSLSINCLQNSHSWIIFPKTITWWLSNDQKNWQQISFATTNADTENQEIMIKSFEHKMEKIKKFRYIKFKATCYGELPAGHVGAGSKAWVFADEIIIK